MRILAFTDLHADMGVLARLVKRAKKDDVDILLTAGDYSIFEEHTHRVLRELDAIGKPVVFIPGNHESETSAKAAEKKYKNLVNIHKKTWEKDDVCFMGYGEGGFAKTDATFREYARKWRSEIKNKKTVFVTHGPPHGTKLDALHDGYVGNSDYTKFAERFQPALYICGHIHENAGKVDKIGKTIVVNPGWEGKVLEIK